MITSSLNFFEIFKHNYLNALKNMFSVSKVYRVQADQGERWLGLGSIGDEHRS